MRTFLLLGTLTCTAMSQAALPPTNAATLAQHMREVNAQWNAQDPIAIDGQGSASFTNEAQRISNHLHLVREQLLSRNVEGLRADQLHNRLSLLDKLNAYADRGRFPRNEVLPYRNPVFIDPYGTACAVGQLMIESGHHDLADRINDNLSLSYLLEMRSSALWPEIAAWANEHGFTADELAWIQPGYPPNYDWLPLGGGTNGNVTVVKELTNGDILLAGEFTQAGGVPAQGVAIWDGTSYTALGTGVLGQVNSAVEYGGNIYLGGAMLNGWSDLARWDGANWNFTTVFNGKYPLINALHVHNDQLYAAGEASGFAGSTEFVQVMGDASWAQVGSAFNAPVLALASHNGSLIAGGSFTATQGPTLPVAMYVASFNGSDWSQYGDGLNGGVRVLRDIDGTLYAGGELYANVAVTFGLARFAAGASYWEHLLPNHDTYIPVGVGPTYINSIVPFNTGLYFGGSFSINPMLGIYGNNLAWFSGMPDEVQAMIILEAPVNGLAVRDQHLIVGGAFEAAYPHAITLDLTTGIDPRNAQHFSLAPNPTVDMVRITTTDASVSNQVLAMTDVAGRRVEAPMVRGIQSVSVDVHDLPAGVYHVIMGDATPLRFVKQ